MYGISGDIREYRKDIETLEVALKLAEGEIEELKLEITDLKADKKSLRDTITDLRKKIAGE